MSKKPSGIGFGAANVKSKAGVKKSEKPEPTLARRLKIYSAMILAGKSKMESALLAGWSRSIARNATQKIERPNEDYFQRLADHFIPDALMMLKTRQGLEATTVKTASFEGVITDIQEFADFATRKGYLELAAQFKGRLKTGSESITGVGVKVIIEHIGGAGTQDKIAAQAAALVVSPRSK